MSQKTAAQKVAYYKPRKELEDFMLRREARLVKQVKHESPCLHPKNTGIKKKDTWFGMECCNVRFNRKSLPKSGKSILNGCFIEKPADSIVTLVWHTKTRALLGVIYNEDNIEKLTEEWSQRFNEIKNL